jgi:hypothetical protein
MSSISIEKKQLLFDYCMGQISPEQQEEIEALIESNEEAAALYASLMSVLKPLENMEIEDCPDFLVEKTVNFVNQHVNSSRQLKNLLDREQTRNTPVKISVWRNFSEMLAAAAAILLIVGVLVPTMGTARQKYRNNLCQAQLGNISRGYNSYVESNDGRQPSVTISSGSPWYMVGNQGAENHSNTRHIFLLVKGGYVESRRFCCPGCKKVQPSEIDNSQIQQLKDFPERSYVTYSFRISCNSTKEGRLTCRQVILSDMNPLFESLPNDPSVTFNVQLDKNKLTVNSRNHNGSGQNVLFGDGRVEFIKTRFIGAAKDDIFTLQDTDIYQGCEVPSTPTDYFLAP